MNIALFVLAWLATGIVSYFGISYGLLLVEFLIHGGDRYRRQRIRRLACEFTGNDAGCMLASVVFAPGALICACTVVAAALLVTPVAVVVALIGDGDKVLFRICRKRDE